MKGHSSLRPYISHSEENIVRIKWWIEKEKYVSSRAFALQHSHMCVPPSKSVLLETVITSVALTSING